MANQCRWYIRKRRPEYPAQRWSEEFRFRVVAVLPLHGKGFAAVPVGNLQSRQSSEFRAANPECRGHLFRDNLSSSFPVTDRRAAADPVWRENFILITRTASENQAGTSGRARPIGVIKSRS